MYACLLGAFVWTGSTVKLGKRTFFEHVRAIWHTEQVQELKTGVEEKAKPAVEKLKRGGEAAYHAITHDGSPVPSDAAIDSRASDHSSDAGAKDASTRANSGSGSSAPSHRRR